jgi:hypothetical protein
MARTPIVPQSETAVHKSLALQPLCEQLRGCGMTAILDLGLARAINVEFWSRFSPVLHISDLHSNLPQHSPEDEIPQEVWRGLLAIPETSVFDAILAWDLLNYLEQTAIASLVEFLNPFCRRGTLLFALIFDTPQMPTRPTVFKIIDPEHIAYETQTPDVRACPRHQPRDIQRIMKGFGASSSFRLRHGVQEYLFSFDAGEVPPETAQRP